MPELRWVALADIVEPAQALRVAMDDTKMQELMDSMREIGQQMPVQLKPRDGHYEIETGHRRFIAAQMMGWSELLAMVYQPGELIEHAAKLAENTCREDITAAEEARFFAELLEAHKLDEAGLCRAVRRSPDYVADRLRLLSGDEDVFRNLQERKISFTVARELNKCGDELQRRYFLHQALASGVGSRVVSRWIAEWRATLGPSPAATPTAEMAPAPATTPAPFFGCELCGGDRDPYNLVSVRLHKHEWEHILKAYLRPPMEVGG